MSGIWACRYRPVVASRAWLDFCFGAPAGAAPATVADDELPGTDHDLFA